MDILLQIIMAIIQNKYKLFSVQFTRTAGMMGNDAGALSLG